MHFSVSILVLGEWRDLTVYTTIQKTRTIIIVKSYSIPCFHYPTPKFDCESKFALNLIRL